MSVVIFVLVDSTFWYWSQSTSHPVNEETRLQKTCNIHNDPLIGTHCKRHRGTIVIQTCGVNKDALLVAWVPIKYMQHVLQHESIDISWHSCRIVLYTWLQCMCIPNTKYVFQLLPMGPLWNWRFLPDPPTGAMLCRCLSWHSRRLGASFDIQPTPSVTEVGNSAVHGSGGGVLPWVFCRGDDVGWCAKMEYVLGWHPGVARKFQQELRCVVRTQAIHWWDCCETWSVGTWWL